MPHDVDNIARVLRSQLDAKLAADFSAAQPGDLLRRPQVGKPQRYSLLRAMVKGGAHLLRGNHQAPPGGFLNLPVGYVKILETDLCSSD